MIRSLPACIAVALAQFAMAQGTWVHLDTSNTPLPRSSVTFLVFDQQGDLWTAEENNGPDGLGLFRFDGTDWTMYDELDHPLLSKGVRYAAVDHDGNMWFAPYMSGLLKFDGSDWTVYDTTNSGLPDNSVYPIAVDGNNALWVGHWMNGISRFDGTTWTHWDENNAPFTPGAECINAIEFYDDKVWVGVDCGGGLLCYDPATDSWTTISGLPNPSISALKNDGQGNLWVGHSNTGIHCISRFDGVNWTQYYPFPSMYHFVYYNGFAVDLAGRLWCGSIGLWYFDDPNWWVHDAPLPIDGPTSNSLSVAVHPEGSVWWAEYYGIWTNHHPLTQAMEEHGSASGALMIYPTPASESVTIGLPTGLPSGTLRLFDAHGRLVREVRMNAGGQAVIERDKLPAGAYSVVVLSDEGTQSMGRVIFE